MYRAGEISKMFISSLMAVHYGTFKRCAAMFLLPVSVIAHSSDAICDRQNNDPLRMSMYSTLVFLNISPNMEKGALQI